MGRLCAAGTTSTCSMTPALRIAIVLNPFSLRRAGGLHAPVMAADIQARIQRDAAAR